MKNRNIKLLAIIAVFLLSLLNLPNNILAIEPEILQGWLETSEMPLNLSNSAAYTNNNKIFSVAGSATVDYSQIAFSNILPNGILNNWQNSTNFPEELYYHQLVKNGDYLYVLGGNNYPPPTSIDRTYYGSPNLDSTVTWLTTTPLPQPRAEGGAVTIGNRLYYLGGMSQTGSADEPTHNDVYFTNLNLDGSIAGWNTTTSLAIDQPKYFIGVVETGKKILTIGGKYDQDNRFSRKVFQSDVNLATGQLGPWEETHPLPDNGGLFTGYNGVGVIRVGDYIIAAGGAVPGGNQSKKVYYTKITSDGGIEPWTTSLYDLPVVTKEGEVQYANGYLYYIGGFSNELGGYHNKVYFTQVDSPVSPPPATELTVPNLKQFSPPWGPTTYDNAQNWYPQDPTMDRWGCAVTSASMVLNYFDYNIDPGELNNYLKSGQSKPIGYTPNGAVMWPAISSYTKKFNAGQSKLEFSYTGDTSAEVIAQLLNSSIPPIIKHNKNGNTHFLVAKGESGETDFLVNDPDSATNLLLTQAVNKWGQVANIGKFTPSQTDVSYLALFVNDSFTFKVFSPSGQEISDGFTSEEPLADSDGNSLNTETLRAFYLPKPASGEYKVEVFGSGDFSFHIYNFDTNGDISAEQINNSLVPGEKKIIITNYDKDNYSNSESEIITFESVIAEWNSGYNSQFIKKEVFYKSVLTLLKDAQKLSSRKLYRASKALLRVAEFLIDSARSNVIDQQFKSEFIVKLQLLSSTIPSTKLYSLPN